MQKLLTLNDLNLSNKRVLIREDFNVPVANGVVKSDVRIRAAVPGIKQALAAGARVGLMSHLGRPEAGIIDQRYSLGPVAKCLEQLLNMPVTFVEDIFNDGANSFVNNQIILYENIRFIPGEVENNLELSRKIAQLCDVYVMDAFACAHRAHASTVGVMQYAPISVAGPLLLREISALDKIMLNPSKPVVAVIGGAKVSTKLAVLLSLLDKVDILIVGGGMANTILASQGIDIGDSICEPDLFPAANKLLNLAKQNNCQLLLPVDQVVDNKQIFDIGEKTIIRYTEAIKTAKTILWNGPMGVFENPKYANGTHKIAQAIASSKAYSVAGGGDTLAALENSGLSEKFSYISTGGGAFLEYLEGNSLPAIQALIHRGK